MAKSRNVNNRLAEPENRSVRIHLPVWPFLGVWGRGSFAAFCIDRNPGERYNENMIAGVLFVPQKARTPSG